MREATAGFLDELRAAVGPDHVRVARHERMAYAYDGTGEKQVPAAVAFPASTAEAAACVRACHRHGVPLVARGAGTNMSGGTVPASGGLVLQFGRMNRVLAIDTANRRAEVEPGVTNLGLQQALAPHGYCFAPDPASQKISTIGGNVAENAGGPHCLKYGVTSGHVVALELVLTDGTVTWAGSPLEEHPGYDLPGLVCGSEGTLAVVSRAVVRITPLPQAYRTLLATFADLDYCVRCVSAIIAARIIPAALELLDRPSIQVLRDSGFNVYPEDTEAALIIEVDGHAADLAAEQERIAAICQEHGATAVRLARGEAERAELWSGRRAYAGALARLNPFMWVQDVTVPRNRLPEMLRAVNALSARYGLRIATVAHAGDGNLHPTFLYNPRDPDEARRVREADAEVIRTCVRLGGSITGEHGVGRQKLPDMELMFTPEQLAYMQRVRHALDPGQQMNPGKLVPVRRGGF